MVLLKSQCILSHHVGTGSPTVHAWLTCMDNWHFNSFIATVFQYSYPSLSDAQITVMWLVVDVREKSDNLILHADYCAYLEQICIMTQVFPMYVESLCMPKAHHCTNYLKTNRVKIKISFLSYV